MAVPNALRSNYGDLFGTTMLPVLEELFRSEYEDQPQQREMIFKVLDTDRDIWQYSELHDMPQFSQVSEGQDYTFSRPFAGSNMTLTPNKFGLGYSISEEAVDDGKFDLIADAVRKMGESARETQEQAAMNVLNNGFTSQTTADGLSLFNAAHTLPGGATFSNVLATAADLSYTSLQTMVQAFETNFKGSTGNFKLIRPRYLVVPTQLKLYAKELVGSDKKVDSGDNNMNSMKDELTVISSPRLTDTVGWFLTADPAKTGLRLVKRKPLETRAASPDSVGFLNDAILYKARYRETIGSVHGYGAFGTAGV